MNNKQLTLLFTLNLIIFSTSNGLLPLLPVYARQLGATETAAGIYLALAYLVLFTGTVTTGRLLAKLKRLKRLFIVMALLTTLASILLGQVSALWQLVILTSLAWFGGGVVITLINILTGLYTGQAGRGKVFGLMFLTLPLGTLVGGAILGKLTDWQGYPATFSALGLAWLVVALLGRFGLADSTTVTLSEPRRKFRRRSPKLQPAFYLVSATALLGSVAVFIGRLGTSFSMDASHFGAGTIAGAAAIGGLVATPAVPLLGALSDRWGRPRFLALTYLLATAGMIVLAWSTQLRHFWLATALLSIAMYAGSSLAAALATDLLSPESLAKGLPLLNAMTWAGGIIGFAATGVLTELVGATNLYLAAAPMPVVGALLLGLLPYLDRWQSLRPQAT